MNIYIAEEKCPMCPRTFIPAPDHQWTIKTKTNQKKNVCSYTCMRKWEKPILEAEKKKAKSKKGLFKYV